MKDDKVPKDNTEQLERMKAYVEVAADGVFALDLLGRFTFVNPTAERLSGYTQGELIGKHFRELLPLKYIPTCVNVFQKSLRGKETPAIEIELITKEGDRKPLELLGRRIRRQGRIVEIVGVARDITKRKRAEEALQKAHDELEMRIKERTADLIWANEQLRREITERKRAGEALYEQAQILSSIRDTIVIITPEMKTIYANQTAKDLFGDRPEMFTEPCYRFFKKRDNFCEDCPVIEVFKDEKSHKAILKSYDKDGREMWRYNTAFPFYDQDGRLVAAIEIVTDYTAQKMAEMALRQSEERYRAIFEQAADSIVLIDAETGALVEFNDRAHQNLGYTREEFEKLKIPDFEVIESAEEVAKHIEKIIKEGGDTFETKHRTKGGEIRDILVSTRAISIHGRDFLQSIWRDITERKRAEEEIRRRSLQRKTIAEVGRTAASILDMDTLLSRVVDLIAQGFGYQRVHIFQVDQDSGYAVYRAGTGEAALNIAEEGLRLKIGEEGFVGWVAQHGEPLLVNDVSQDPRYYAHPDLPDTRSELEVPIRAGEKVIGVLDVQSAELNAFDEGDLATLQTLADQLAVAIENARLFEGERRKATQLAVINEVGRKATSILDLHEMLKGAASSICSGFDYYNVALFLVDEERHEAVIEAFAGGFEHYVPGEYRQSLDQGIIGWVIRTGRSWLANDVSQDPYYIKGFLEEVLTKSELCVPIKLGGEVIGALDIQSIHLNAFDETDVTAMETLSGQIAIAIENARLYEETKRLAVTDPLTGVWNRRHIEERFRSEVARTRRFHHPLSALVMDIDNLKLFNDTYGHPAGDNVIRTVAQTVLISCREIDVVGRYGGDEFALLLPETGTQGAAIVAKRILAALEKEPFEAPDGTKLPIKISIGAASYPSDSDEADRLFSLADAAMYRVKVAGGGEFASLTVGPEEVPEELAAPFDVLLGLLTAVDTKDRYTFKHSQEVTERALALARAVGLSEEAMRALEIAGKLHDVGKIGIPTTVLRKPGALTPEEWRMIREHPRLGYLILQQLPQMEMILDAVLHHHERWDGNGYPDGLKGKQIPKLARILAIADAFSAMMTDRPYRAALTEEEALAELEKGAGTQWDPQVVEVFVKIYEEGAFEGAG